MGVVPQILFLVTWWWHLGWRYSIAMCVGGSWLGWLTSGWLGGKCTGGRRPGGDGRPGGANPGGCRPVGNPAGTYPTGTYWVFCCIVTPEGGGCPG